MDFVGWWYSFACLHARVVVHCVVRDRGPNVEVVDVGGRHNTDQNSMGWGWGVGWGGGRVSQTGLVLFL